MERTAEQILENNADGLSRVAFGGGCHWCTEAVFQSLKGVEIVEQGFVRCAAPDDAWSEAALIAFDAATITLDHLIDVHLTTHSSASRHKMRGKYRSAVYVLNENEVASTKEALARAGAERVAPLVTQVLMLSAFKPSDERFRNYYTTDPHRPFCQTYIEPKLKKIRRDFSDIVR